STSRSSTTSPSPGTSRAPPMRIAAPSRPSATRSPVLAGRSSSPPGPSGSHRGGWRPNRTGMIPARRWPLWAAARWPAVHRLDSAHLFRLALENAPAGSTLHAVADEGVQIRDIAEVIGRHLGLPVVSISPEDAAGHFTWLAHFLSADSPASSTLTRELLGWHPTQPGLIDDLDKGHSSHTPPAYPAPPQWDRRPWGRCRRPVADFP